MDPGGYSEQELLFEASASRKMLISLPAPGAAAVVLAATDLCGGGEEEKKKVFSPKCKTYHTNVREKLEQGG